MLQAACNWQLALLCADERMHQHGISCCGSTPPVAGSSAIAAACTSAVLLTLPACLTRCCQAQKMAKRCPRCGMATQKAEGCNKMSCGGCGAYWCWCASAAAGRHEADSVLIISWIPCYRLPPAAGLPEWHCPAVSQAVRQGD